MKVEVYIEHSYTCCNAQVSVKAGSEVICPECGEWVITKKAE
jgi:predicted RNA-binding Zn-ribbon protein involved in translation (DUF1610 family)